MHPETFRTRVCIPHVNVCVYVHERKLRRKEGGYGVIFIELVRLISLSIEEFDSIVVNTRRTNHCARESCVIAVVDVHSSYALHIFLDMLKITPRSFNFKYSTNENASHFNTIIDFIALLYKIN